MNGGWGDSQGLISVPEDEDDTPQPTRSWKHSSFFHHQGVKMSDDADRQFWAEDELSSVESRSLVRKRKRRRSASYRNKRYRSKSRASSSSTASDTSGRRRRRKRGKKSTETANSDSSKRVACGGSNIPVRRTPFKKLKFKFCTNQRNSQR